MNAIKKKLFFFGKGEGAPAPVGLLNTAEGAGAAFAISLRMLNADLIGEDAIEVKRVANSDFDRFPLTADGVPLDQIASFCGASDGIVPWILDQSGNVRHLSNPTESQCPLLYTNGEIVKTNGRPVLKFDGVDDHLFYEFTEPIDMPFSLFSFFKYNTKAGGNIGVNLVDRQSGYYCGSTSFNGIASVLSAYPEGAGIPNDTQPHVNSTVFNGGNSVTKFDQSAIKNNLNYGNGSIERIYMGATYRPNDGTDFEADVNYGELIMYPSNKTSGVAELHQNIIDHYGIS